ncbi:MAG TPA: hypothetical protein DDY72_00425 [Verrucomicrobia bacterium]|nr:hypothetical protein [Verrucomicrobiota bacterium]
MTLAFLFDSVGFGEWVVLLAVILVVVGPKRLPATARKFGQYYAKFRRAAETFKRQLLDMDSDLGRAINDIDKSVGEVRSSLDEVNAQWDAGMAGYPPPPAPETPKPAPATSTKPAETAASSGANVHGPDASQQS